MLEREVFSQVVPCSSSVHILNSASTVSWDDVCPLPSSPNSEIPIPSSHRVWRHWNHSYPTGWHGYTCLWWVQIKLDPIDWHFLFFYVFHFCHEGDAKPLIHEWVAPEITNLTIALLMNRMKEFSSNPILDKGLFLSPTLISLSCFPLLRFKWCAN